MKKVYKILILGASYGSLLGTKLAFAGHTVKLVCLPTCQGPGNPPRHAPISYGEYIAEVNKRNYDFLRDKDVDVPRGRKPSGPRR